MDERKYYEMLLAMTPNEREEHVRKHMVDRLHEFQDIRDDTLRADLVVAETEMAAMSRHIEIQNKQILEMREAMKTISTNLLELQKMLGNRVSPLESTALSNAIKATIKSKTDGMDSSKNNHSHLIDEYDNNIKED